MKHSKKSLRIASFCVAVFTSLLSLSVTGAESKSNVRIVDYGNDMGTGEIFYRGKAAKKATGTAPNETFSFWEFSISEPLNPTPLRYDIDQKNARLYGGLVIRALNNPQRAISEGHMNSDHDFQDDFNFMGGLAPHLPDERLEAYGLWFWQKPDFLNGGDKYHVSFNNDSFIAVHISRYFGGFHSAHWLVRDGEQFYVSKASFGKYISLKNNKDNDSVLRTSHVLKPLDSEWAEYNPTPPYNIFFDPKSAKFAKKEFKNITAVGWLIVRELSAPEKVYNSLRPPFAVKWSAFRCDAVVSTPPEQISYYVPMTRLKDANLAFSNEMINFQQWEKVRRISVTNQYCHSLGYLNYSFIRDGSMGTMRADDAPHSAVEPVTDIEWIDAINFCNALSEFEGKTPCYYEDANFAKVLRRPIRREFREEWDKRPVVYWKSSADGYRLPTTAEREKIEENISQNASAKFLEYIWDSENPSIDEQAVEAHTLLTASPDSAKQLKDGKTLLPFPEKPYHGHYLTGFRIVSGEVTNLKKTQTVKLHSCEIRKEALLQPINPSDKNTLRKIVEKEMPLVFVKDAGLANENDFVDPVEDPDLEKRGKIAIAEDQKFLGKISEEEYRKMIEENKIEKKPRKPYDLRVARCEVSYRIWKLVKNWAENNGYSFNYAGDMGSMRHSTDKAQTHEQNESVTFISWHDALVWCNALSEIFDKNPVYFNDADKKQPYKIAILFRLNMFDARNGHAILPWEGNTKRAKMLKLKPHTGSCIKIFFDGASDGFRLPTNHEFKIVEKSSQLVSPELEWTAANSGGKTQGVLPEEVADLQLFGVSGNVLEWGWDMETSYFHKQNAIYDVNGRAYFYEDINAAKKEPFYSDYPANARTFIGFRVSSR